MKKKIAYIIVQTHMTPEEQADEIINIFGKQNEELSDYKKWFFEEQKRADDLRMELEAINIVNKELREERDYYKAEFECNTDKKYTEEDMRKCWDNGRKNKSKYQETLHIDFNDYIDKLNNNPKS